VNKVVDKKIIIGKRGLRRKALGVGLKKSTRLLVTLYIFTALALRRNPGAHPTI
jgi:hypothetical protein